MNLKEYIRQALEEEASIAHGNDEVDGDRETARYLLRDDATGITVREATLRDAPELAELGARAFRHAHASLLDPWDLAADVTSRFDEAKLRTELSDPDSHWIVAFWDRTLTGFAQLSAGTVPIQVKERLPLELSGVYVAPDWMGHGVGSALIRGSIRLAGHLGRESLWVTAWAGNQRAIDFFEGWGFSTVGGGRFRIGKRGEGELVILARPVSVTV